MLHTASQAHKQVQEELGSFRCNVCCDSCSSCAWKNGPIKLGNLNNYLPEKTIAIRFEAIASKVEAMAIRFEAIAIRLEAIASKVEAIAIEGHGC